jgi:Asp-tRNA(Asn)/Glu-tRNA(Gln) amidotransferase A subunit family amidase
MESSSLQNLSAVDIVASVSRGDATCEEVARACLQRIAARDASVKAWAHLDPRLVIAEARALDRQSPRGPLHGVPLGVKDVIDTCDMPTGMGSPIYQNFQPTVDASCVAMLRQAGALVFGKTVTCEFAGATPAQTTNPHDVARTPGGSSSGSAAAVADFMVPLALGTQTGGSILRPASYCGVVGYKPTYGLISCVGVKIAAASLDTVGFLSRTVEDLELAARVLTHAREVTWLAHGTHLRIGLCRTRAWGRAAESTRSALLDAATRLASHGHEVREVELPAPFSELSTTREIINDYERARALAGEWQTKGELISAGLAESIRRGLSMPAERYIWALRQVERCRQLLTEVFTGLDVLLAPTVDDEAPLGLTHTGDHTFQSIWTQLQTPNITLPTHRGLTGLPVGIQLIARTYEDTQLLAIARLLFQQLGRGRDVH